MGRSIAYIFAIYICILSYQPADAGTDGPPALLCSVIKVNECSMEEGCLEGTAESVDVPQFLKVDFRNNIISTVGKTEQQRESRIRNLKRVDGKVIMQGAERGRGWNMVIEENTGKLSATIVEERVGFVIFGACTSL